MRRVYLDSCAVDPFLGVNGALDRAKAAVVGDQLEVLFSHVTLDEVAATPDSDRRGALLLVLFELGTLVPTGAVIWDFSRWDHARWINDAEAFEEFRVGNIKNTCDALHAATAQFEDCELITVDEKLTKRARRRGVVVTHPTDLLRDIGVTD
jgi:hypothetical protein